VSGVPEGRRIFPGLTVLDNLRVGAHTRGRQAASDVDWALDLFPGLRAQAYRPAGALPAGEQQVLALARALVSRPKLLVVDELSAGVSPALACQLFDVLRGLSLAGVALLVIDQFVNLTLGLADRALVVDNGGVSVRSEPGSLVPADVSWQSTHPGGAHPSANRSKGAPG
jgi:branched-chain amino acid transport system ATP-binding protein